ncbi:MAG TPA: HEAT repeat domain-containing protein [Gemmataceae bacterium]|nr:HEAT repeat domain-containing protein [Gemmataceae bacterium]
MSLYPEHDQLSLDELIHCFEGPPSDGGDERTRTYYTEVAFHISAKGQSGIDFLKGKLDKVDTDRLIAALSGLAATRSSINLPCEVLARYLLDSRPHVVAEAIDALTAQRNKDIGEQVMALLHHPDPYVKGSVLRYLSQLCPEKAIAELLDALNDSHFIVRERAVDELGELSAAETIPFIRPLLNDPHPHVRQAARTAIDNLSEPTDPRTY